MLHKIDTKNRLYVVTCKKGYSCVGFNVADLWMKQIWEWMGEPFPDATVPGTVEHYIQYQRAMDMGRQHADATSQRCPADLTPQLVNLEGERVEVVDCHGDRRRFWVGCSTGWMPCHLEVVRRGSIGGIPTYGTPYRSVTVLKTSR